MVTTYAPAHIRQIIEAIPLDDMLPVSEASTRYRVSKETIYRLIREEVLAWDKPTLKGEARVNHADLRMWLHATGRLPSDAGCP